jgi:agmatinase
MLDEYRRAPGPISLDHYMFQKGGIPTFAHAPVAVRKEDLIAGKVEVAFVGIPSIFPAGGAMANMGRCSCVRPMRW